MKSRQARLRSDAALLALAAALLIAIVVPALAPARPALALAACALLPGAAALTLVPVDNFLTWCLVSVLLSLAIETLTSLITLWLSLWNPALLAAVLGLLSVGLLGLDLVKAARLQPAPEYATR